MFRRGAWLLTRRGIVVALAVLATAGIAARGCTRKRAASSAEMFRRVSVSRQELRLTKTATGEVTPQNRVEIKPPIAGRIEEVLVREGQSVTKGQVLVWMSSAERAALLDAARAQGEESMARWESAYKPAPLTAPLDGTVIVRAVEPGQTVATTDPVVVIADRLIVKAQVDETDIGAVKPGQPARISLDAYPEEDVRAHVDHVAYEATTVNNVTIYEVDVLPDQVPEVMRSGMTATVTFIVAEKPDALVVPAEAVRAEGAGASVLVPGERPWGRPASRDVTIGLSDGKWTEITGGLSEGDAILAPSLRMPARASRRGNPLSPFGAGGGRGSGSGSRNRGHP